MTKWIKPTFGWVLIITLIIVTLLTIKHCISHDESEEHRLIRSLQKAFITQMDKSNDLKCCMIGVAGRDEIKEFSFCKCLDLIAQAHLQKMSFFSVF